MLHRTVLFKILFCFAVLFGSSLFVRAATLLEATEYFQNGELKSGIEVCKAIIGESEDLSDDLCKSYIQAGIAYMLEDAEDVDAGISSLRSLLEGYMSEDGEKSKIEAGLAILAYLIGKSDESVMSQKLDKLENDWKAVSVIAKYLVNLKRGSDSKTLVGLSEEYFSLLSGFKTDCWATAWYPRLKLWNKWVLNGDGDKNSLEKLVAENGMSSRKSREKAKSDEKYALISSIIESYLKNDIEGAKKLAESAIKRLSAEGGDKSAPTVVILSLLSQRQTPTFQDVFNMTRTDPQLWSLGALSFFVRYASEKNKPEQNIFLQCLDNYKNNSGTGELHPDVAKWKEKVVIWEKWCEDGFKENGNLEPLLVSCSRSMKSGTGGGSISSAKPSPTSDSANGAGLPSLEDIKTEDFIALREMYQKRPRPSGLLFKDDEIKKHMAALPEQARKLEMRRYESISKIREYLIKILERNAYPKGLKLKGGGTASGQVAMANENIVIVRSGKKNKRYEWSDLAFEQFESFLLYYAQQRTTTSGGIVSKEESKKNAAQDFLLLAILCDWYGKYDSALKYGRKAASLDESIRSSVSELLFK